LRQPSLCEFVGVLEFEQAVAIPNINEAKLGGGLVEGLDQSNNLIAADVFAQRY